MDMPHDPLGRIGNRLARWVTLKGPRDALRHIMTASDGETYVPGRVLWVLGSGQFMMLSAWTVIADKNPFDPVAYSTGLSAILVAGGAGVWLASKRNET